MVDSSLKRGGRAILDEKRDKRIPNEVLLSNVSRVHVPAWGELSVQKQNYGPRFLLSRADPKKFTAYQYAESLVGMAAADGDEARTERIGFSGLTDA